MEPKGEKEGASSKFTLTDLNGRVKAKDIIRAEAKKVARDRDH